jgi:RimJ/RimL family protein N-acetyltransferase
MTFVAVAGEREKEDIVGSVEYAVDEATNLAEIAFTIRPDWQSVGLGSALQQRMTEYAKSKGLRGFTYGILEENVKMRRIAERSPNATTKVANDIVEVTVLF